MKNYKSFFHFLFGTRNWFSVLLIWAMCAAGWYMVITTKADFSPFTYYFTHVFLALLASASVLRVWRIYVKVKHGPGKEK